ncbi:hypothetical protein B0H16DRAFT_1462295 [Mycena metata]|uniref:F-box domain-containing protein n=1 Tax=Mycena metata TaxID=1033252 RepID=A0AAD7INE2_9AGAR|nr:hypothetical protein B0H16DRAFT_1462295 [Mycena metata]
MARRSNNHSPLLRLPPELLEHLALHLATLPPNLGPPTALLPFLATCRAVYAKLGWSHNTALWAKIARAKFALGGLPKEVSGYGEWAFDGDPAVSTLAGVKRARGKLAEDAQTLRTLCLALRVIRSGDPHVPGAARALIVAYWMLVGDDGEEGEQGTLTNPSRNRNRRHLAWAAARSFSLRYVRERLYLGRWGERGRVDDMDDRPEHATPAWRVGWPRDTEAGAAALWVVWFFEGEETLRAEPEPLRRHLMSLLFPFVVAPFRYASALAPPHHYSIPLLPSVFGSQSAALNAQLQQIPLGPELHEQGVEGEGAGQRRAGAITVPTNHGSFPIYALGAPRPPPRSSARPGPGRPTASGPSAHGPSASSAAPPNTHAGPPSKTETRSRLLTAPPARLLFFARMQVGSRMGVPPHLPRDRVEAVRLWLASGETGPQPVRPTQADIHEKNGRPIVRFERQLPGLAPFTSPTSTSASPSASAASTAASTSTTASSAAPPPLSVDPQLDANPLSDGADGEGSRRWGPHRWRGRLCRGYGGESSSSSTVRRSAGACGRSAGDTRGNQGKGGAPPGRIGRVYELGSFAGLWAGTMLMPSEPPYTALIGTPGGALPLTGLPRDDFAAALRPVYMRIREYQSFAPHAALPPPPANPTTADEGLREGWVPGGMRVVGAGGGRVEVRVPAGGVGVGTRRGEEDVYEYESVVEGRVREGAHDVERCPGCVRVGERERARRGRAEAFTRPGKDTMEEDNGEEEMVGYRGEDGVESYESGSSRASGSGSFASASASRSGSRSGSSAHSQFAPSASPQSQSVSASASPTSSTTSSKDWPEWSAPAWAGHRFDVNDDDEEEGGDGGWEAACDGVQDVVFAGATDPHHGQAWHHYDIAGRVRPWDGLIGLVMRPRDRTLDLATYFISGHIIGRDTFEGTWQMASQDVLAPSWGGSICLARGED